MKKYIKQFLIAYLTIMLIITVLLGPIILMAFTHKQECLWLYLITLPAWGATYIVCDINSSKDDSDNL